MSDNVIFIRPVEEVGAIYDILKSCNHSNFPVVDTEDKGILFGTIGRDNLCILLQQRAFGRPKKESSLTEDYNVLSNYLSCEDEKFLPLVQWQTLEKSYPTHPSVSDLRIGDSDRECLVDLRPYANTAPVTVQESSTVSVSSALLVFSCIF